MRWNAVQMRVWMGLCLLLLAGCGRVPDDRREARDRYLRRAEAAKNAQDIDGAIAYCEKAVQRRPDLALAHRELGLMLDNFRQDYVGAIYHYQRYLQLRPDSENREAIEQLIRHCRVSFAAQIQETPEEWKNDLRARDLRIQKLELELSDLRAGKPVVQQEKPPAKETKSIPLQFSSAAAPTNAPAVQVHIVQVGENLATISTKYYGTPSKWKTIFNANRERLTDANNLRVGTQITIPKE